MACHSAARVRAVGWVFTQAEWHVLGFSRQICTPLASPGAWDEPAHDFSVTLLLYTPRACSHLRCVSRVAAPVHGASGEAQDRPQMREDIAVPLGLCQGNLVLKELCRFIGCLGGGGT